MFDVKRSFVDSESSINIMFLHVFLGMGKSKKDLKKVEFPLIELLGRITSPIGAIRLLVILGEG